MKLARTFPGRGLAIAVIATAGVALAGPGDRRAIPTSLPTATATPSPGAAGASGASGMVAPQPGQASTGGGGGGSTALGWPHDIKYGAVSVCNREPFPLEVMVFENPNFTGKCAILTPGFYPNGNQLGVQNDSISSIKVGQLVRARAFKDGDYGGGFTIYGASTPYPTLTGDWNDRITSVRVEPAARHVTCDDVLPGEIALYQQENYGGDCVVLPGDGSASFATAAQMGTANDSISSIWNNSGKELFAYDETSFSGIHSILVPARTKVPELSKDRRTYIIAGIDGMNDHISSVVMR